MLYPFAKVVISFESAKEMEQKSSEISKIARKRGSNRSKNAFFQKK